MARVVVIGAGLGGLPAAYELRHYLGQEHQVTLVSEFSQFTFIPGLVHVALGHVPLDRVQLDLGQLARRHKLEWVQGKVERIDPLKKCIYTADRDLAYDYLIIASGSELANDLVPGLGVYSHSVCTPVHALAAKDAWEEFCAHPGDLLVGAAPGAGCFGPAYEFVLSAEADLRRRGIRDRVQITYITPEPYIGHLGIAQVHQARQLTEGLMQERHISTITNAEIKEITPDRVYLADGRSFKQAYTMVLASFRGAEFVRVSGLGNAKGFLPVLPTLRHEKYPEIYGVGVSVQLDQPDKTPVPIGLPKSGQMTEAMAMVAAHNIAVDLGVLKRPLEVPTLEALCFAEYGETGIAYIAAPIIPDPKTGKRRYSYAARGVWVNWAKASFEHYFMVKMRFGLGLPWFERLGLQLLFGLSLSRPVPEDVRQIINV
ncbi:MAG: sulfide:quinone reductase [Cyanobacteria bacterium M5B4]|nr:FAD-dependent oxidoreductase [Cyanobacteria bacterium KgW148]PLS69548.1 MAG: sulfide:quinone reductase [Cyanobacteria bacterium M5B4]